MKQSKSMLLAKVQGELPQLRDSLQLIDDYLADSRLGDLDYDYLTSLEREVSNAIGIFEDF